MEERFDILRLFGKGRTGGVYEAIDLHTNQRVALRRFFSVTGETDSSPWRDSFIQLAHNLAQIHHPALMGIYGSGVDDDGAFMSMELMEGGRSIEEIIDSNGHLSDENFYVMANNLLDAFSVVHQRGFCHGSVSARSVMEVPLATGGHVYKCVDLGVSSLIPMINPNFPLLGIGDPALTAPEIFEGAEPDARSDVYMLGHLFYLSLAGGHPLAGIPSEEAYKKHKAHKFAPLSGYRSSVGKDIVDWLELLTQADPAARPANAGEALNLMPIYQFGNNATASPAIETQQLGQPTTAMLGHAPVVGTPYAVSNPALPGATRVASSSKKSSAGPIVAILGVLAVLLIIVIAVSSRGKPVVPEQNVEEESVAENRIEGSDEKLTPNKVNEPVEPVSKEVNGTLAQRVEFSALRVVASAEAVKSGKLATPVIEPEKASAWLYYYQGDPISGGKMEIESKFPKGGASSIPKSVGVNVLSDGEVMKQYKSWQISGGLPGESQAWGFRFQKIQISGDLKCRLFFSAENVSELEVVLKSSVRKSGELLHELGGANGLCAIDFTLGEVKKWERFGLEFRVRGLQNTADSAHFTPLAFVVYDGAYPELPSYTEKVKQPVVEKKPVKPEYVNGVKVTQGADGIRTLKLKPVTEGQ